MIMEFKLENWMSFKEETSFSMIPGNITEYPENIYYDGEDKVLKSAVFYGANASGKSNVFKAIKYFRGFLVTSHQKQQVGDLTKRNSFKLDHSTRESPTMLEMTFLTKSGNTYRYGYTLNDESVLEEWLDILKDDNFENLMERDTNEDMLAVNEKVLSGEISGNVIKSLVNKNTLILSFLATTPSDVAREIIEYMKSIKYIDSTDNIFMSKAERLQIVRNKDYKKKLLNLLEAADLGIGDITVEESDELLKGIGIDLDEVSPDIRKKLEVISMPIMVSHKMYDFGVETGKQYNVSMEEFESKGTQKIISLSYKIIETLMRGETLIIDELDTQLHPLMLKAIVAMFNNKHNSRGAQLLFTTHDITLIDASARLFRRDQVWFAEKNKVQESTLYSLFDFKYSSNGDDFKSIRKDENFAINYLRGKYRAIPIITDLSEQIKWEECDNG